jgi:hypothetical protein
MKKLLYLFCTSLLILTSCSKDDGQNVTADNSVLVKKATMNDGASTDFLEYSYNGKKLTRIKSSINGVAFFDFTYNGDLIIGSKRYDDNNVLQFEMIYGYDNNQRLVSEKTLSKFYGFGGKRIFVYNSDGTIGITEYSGDLINQDIIIGTGKIWLNGEGETIKVEEYQDNALVSRTEYTYDDKNNVFKNISGYSKLFLTGEIPKTHNILTCKRYDSNNALTSSSSCKYTYNAANYPVSVITSFEGVATGTTEWVY